MVQGKAHSIEEHKTEHGYSTHGCRCSECRAAHNERQKAYYANHVATDPAYRERYRETSRRSVRKMRLVTEKWEKEKERSRKASRARRDLIQQIKLERGCADCGYREHPEALEFHHRDRDAKFSGVSRIKTLSLEKLFAEIAKCEVLCANCHRIRTCNERQRASDLKTNGGGLVTAPNPVNPE